MSDTLQDAKNMGKTLAREGYSAIEIGQAAESIRDDNIGQSDTNMSRAYQTVEEAAITQNQNTDT